MRGAPRMISQEKTLAACGRSAPMRILLST
ncbi:hypothetical protein PAERUG_P53_London_9_VIM_2_02_13_05319 [Pseudomonas aeruginosa]|nr:hypothetical protein PAERUG_P53_London_9_VIM_2_02_13_05319 [Pseudomonas aeruginosa]